MRGSIDGAEELLLIRPRGGDEVPSEDRRGLAVLILGLG